MLFALSFVPSSFIPTLVMGLSLLLTCSAFAGVGGVPKALRQVRSSSPAGAFVPSAPSAPILTRTNGVRARTSIKLEVKDQTDSQMGRNIPLSQLKRKPKKRRKDKRAQQEEPQYDEVRPMFRATSREAQVQGTDYWVDEKLLEEERARELQRKERAKDVEGQFEKAKLREEIVTPYKNQWLVGIIAGITILAIVLQLFPDLLSAPVIQLPQEL